MSDPYWNDHQPPAPQPQQAPEAPPLPPPPPYPPTPPPTGAYGEPYPTMPQPPAIPGTAGYYNHYGYGYARPVSPPQMPPRPPYPAAQPIPRPAAPTANASPERRSSMRVLVYCLALPLSCLLISLIVLSAAGIRIDTADNGTMRLWLGPESTARPTFTTAPPPTMVPAALPEVQAPDGEMSAEQVYRKVAPSVVGILADSYYSEATGSGMILSEDGYILTNHHVIADADEIIVVLPDGEELEAKLIGSDYLTDIAVLKVSRTGLVPVEFGSSETMVTGAKCYAIGNPLGMTLQNTFTDGMISAINRDIVLSDDARGEIMMTVLQTNCAVNPGNSGGPLLNRQGQVIGIVSSKIMGDYYTSVEGLGFAIPVDTAVPVVNSLIDYGYVKGRPMIGIVAAATQLDEQTAADLGLPLGVVIGEVNIRSDAYRKGIRTGDIVTHVNDEEVTSVLDINRIKNRFRAGDTLKLTIYSKGTVQDIDIVLGDASDNQ